MKTILVTGSAGLIGAEAVGFFAKLGFHVIGIDNDMRRYFFGADASTAWSRRQLEQEFSNYVHLDADIRDQAAMERVFAEHGSDLDLIIHTAAQPSHDWAAREPFTDFSVNAVGTLTLLEMTRRYCPDSGFIYTSTNKVYGDLPNFLPRIEKEMRWELAPTHPYAEHGIDETMSIDQSKHSLFGASKLAADVMVQEYGRYFGMKTACFRGGCLTGPGHSGTMLHGFLAYLMKCVITGQPYTVFGYKGKQVRDNIHSYDLVNAFYYFYQNPRVGEVYNMGGSRHANCSMVEAIILCEEIAGKKLEWTYSETNRSGDHIWWISDVRKFQAHYPAWQYKYGLKETLVEIYEGLVGRELPEKKMDYDVIRWAVRTSPSRHLSDYLARHYRKNVRPNWQWVDCTIAGQSFQLKVNTGEIHGYLCYLYGILEPNLTFFIRHLIPSKRFLLDIGANVGYYTVLNAIVNPDCLIYSFEPSPATFEVLCENVNANHLLNVHTNQLALGDTTGMLKFNIYPDQAFNSPRAGETNQHPFFKEVSTQVVDVPSVKLDDFLGEHLLPQPDIIKLDVEGFEYFVLKGASKLLASDNPPILFCEVQSLWLKRFGLGQSDMFSLVEQFGYQILGLTHYGLVHKEELDQYPSTEDFIFTPRSGLAEIMEINECFYSGWRKAKGETKKILRPIWRRLTA